MEGSLTLVWQQKRAEMTGDALWAVPLQLSATQDYTDQHCTAGAWTNQLAP